MAVRAISADARATWRDAPEQCSKSGFAMNAEISRGCLSWHW
jgi:hypothetical protein